MKENYLLTKCMIKDVKTLKNMANEMQFIRNTVHCNKIVSLMFKKMYYID